MTSTASLARYRVGDLDLTRMGYGAMQLAGPHVFGPPKDRDAAIRVLRAVVDLGINHMDTADYFLLDTYVEGVEGGTGETFNWDVAKEAIARYGKPVFLAGGLTPENVGDAVEAVRPYAVDAASGVERLPKRKDFEKLKDFITNAKKA